MNPVTRISPVTDAEAARMARPETLADLAGQITAVPPAAPGGLAASRGTGRWAGKGRWLIGLPVAAALAIALLVVTSLGRPGQRVGPVTVGPPAAQALSFSRHGVRSPSSSATRWPTRPGTGPSSPGTTCTSRSSWCRCPHRWSAPWST